MEVINVMDNFIGLIIDENDLDEFKRHLQLKGYERYQSIFNYLLKSESNVTYKKLSHYYRYDIRIRRVLYKSITLLETSMKAYINNKYKGYGITFNNYKEKFEKIFDNNIKFSHINEIKLKRYLKTSKLSLYELLEEFDTGLLFELYSQLDPKKVKGYFENIENLESRLDRARSLRNKVYHHNILIIREHCYKDTNYTLNEAIDNLVHLIPANIRENLSVDINDTIYIDECYEKCAENKYIINDEDIINMEG